jgi:hypothetical protein
MTLNGDRIKSTSGKLYGHLFANETAGAPLGLYWNVFIQCENIEDGQDSLSASVSCDWLTWPISKWQELDGMSLSETLRPAMVESSFYLNEHHPLRIDRLNIRRIRASSDFRVGAHGEFSLRGMGELDGDHIVVDAEADIQFSGIYVVPANLTSIDDSEIGVRSSLSHFIDLSGFLPPRWEGFRYVFQPRP